MIKNKTLIAKANELTKTGKIYDESNLKMHAKESPGKYFYDNDIKSLFEERRSKQRK